MWRLRPERKNPSAFRIHQKRCIFLNLQEENQNFIKRNEEIQKLEEENKQLREKVHRTFIQQSGLELLGKIEKEENDKEKNKNLQEFKRKQEELELRNKEIQAKISG